MHSTTFSDYIILSKKMHYLPSQFQLCLLTHLPAYIGPYTIVSLNLYKLFTNPSDFFDDIELQYTQDKEIRVYSIHTLLLSLSSIHEVQDYV